MPYTHKSKKVFCIPNSDHTTRVVPENSTTIWNLVDKNHKSKYFNDEIDHELKFRELGYLATANKGPNLNNSEFFITLTKADLSSMNGKHTVFGRVE